MKPIDHIQHIEDLLFVWPVDKVRALYDKIILDAFNASRNVSLKYDGSPSVFVGRLSDGVPYVSTKSLLNKTPIYYVTKSAIRERYSGDLAESLCHLLDFAEAMPSRASAAMQGDVMWTSLGEIAKENVIAYKKPDPSKPVGVVWHSVYFGDPGALELSHPALPMVFKSDVVASFVPTVDFRHDDAIYASVEDFSLYARDFSPIEPLFPFLRKYLRSSRKNSFVQFVIQLRWEEYEGYKTEKRRVQVDEKYNVLLRLIQSESELVRDFVYLYGKITLTNYKFLSLIRSGALSPYTYDVAQAVVAHEGIVWRDETMVVKVVSPHIKRLLQLSPYSK